MGEFTLAETQTQFMKAFAEFVLVAIKQGYTIKYGEAFRTHEQARAYHAAGKGIINSNHCKSLAVDIFILNGSAVDWNLESYRPLGKLWESMHPLARWGGNFKNRDGVHFSFEWKGVK